MHSVDFSLLILILIPTLGLAAESGRSAKPWAFQTKLEEGLITGYQKQYGNETIVMFKGVPFAEPPTKQDRFAHPQPKKPWDNTWDCSNYQRNCPNISPVSLIDANGTEDCLYLNVFANSRCFNNSCPVMFYIHGGSFFFGYPLETREEEIVEKYVSSPVVFVTLSYRENIFGFLNFEEKTVDDQLANAGFHDILLALKFIKRNVNKMGGDPSRITVMGNSSGGSAVLYLISSPAVEADLFSQAWISSPMPYVSPKRNTEMTRVVSKAVGCKRKATPNATADALRQLKCLRQVPERQLTHAAFNGLSQYEWTHTGPQSDHHLLPVANFGELVKWWKPRRLWFSTTSKEMEIEVDETNYHMCQHYCPILGYTSIKTFVECAKNFFNRRKSIAQVYHALTRKLAQLNAQGGAETFVEYFDQPNHTYHATNLLFVLGWHKPQELTESEAALDEVYHKWIVNFVSGRAPNEDFTPYTIAKPAYYHINYQVEGNKTTSFPHMVYNESLDPEGDQFWLHDLQLVEDPFFFNQTSSSPTTGSTATTTSNPLYPLRRHMKNARFNFHFMTSVLMFMTCLLLVTTFVLLWNRLQSGYRRTTIYLNPPAQPTERTPLIQNEEESAA
ncbi:unnamed protein product [Bursaphelenchus xylophilus]|uniref:(pine wood nematode) hypothetical protein n=1 Tax=Bursaphelenchus xylophilus TaxID=6326 RepID=A0A1I7RJE9_BURXY|nr:unnamed protein product [Bursaphelenchus xylophilus]CAG9128836.1 unnamed protein product [Bursaphelenchus xylophilus]